MELPKRKHPRLKYFNYNNNGYYFITICTYKNINLLSTVGRGLAPAASNPVLTPIGVVAEKQLIELQNRYKYVKIDKYVIMPTHIHVIIALEGNSAGASPRPTLTDIVCAYKSITTRICNQKYDTAGRRVFQTSFYERIIRDRQEYLEICQYIASNPLILYYSKHNKEQYILKPNDNKN